MGRGKELKRILDDPFRNPDEYEDALDGLANLHTKEAIEAIGEIERDPFRPQWLRDKARKYLMGD